MFTKIDLAEFRFETATRINLEERDMPNGGNYTIGRAQEPYEVSISSSVLKMGHNFTNMVMAVVGMPKGPWNWQNVREFRTSRNGEEGSFFYRNHLIRWYIDFHDDKTPSLYVMKDSKVSWWNRAQYRFRNTQRLREVRRRKHISYA